MGFVIHRTDHNTMNGLEKRIHGTLFFTMWCAGIFAALTASSFAGTLIGFAPYDLRDDWTGDLGAAIGGAAALTWLHFRPPAQWKREHDLTVPGLHRIGRGDVDDAG